MVDQELGVYLSRNQRLHIHEETHEETLSEYVGKLLQAQVTSDPRKAQELRQEVNDAVAGTRESNLLHASHSLKYMAAILEKGTYWRRCKAFLRVWMDDNLMNISGAVCYSSLRE